LLKAIRGSGSLEGETMKEQHCSPAGVGGKHLTQRASDCPAVVILRIILVLSLLLPDLAASAAEQENQEGMQKAGAGWIEPVPETAPAELPGDSPDDSTKLAFTTSPEYAVAGETITVTWQLTPGEDLLAQTLEIEAAEGLTPLGESASLFNPSTRTLSLPLKE
jgi:hypothetical protein